MERIYKEKTIMDVMGNTRDENMCSNMLAFYFNPNEEHELDNIVLKALIDILENKKLLNNYEYKNISIIREFKTINGKRIDIVIKNDDYVIGIENKIDASLYNNLNDYSKTLDRINKNAIKIVLSINNVETNYDETGFINITYLEFLQSLENLLNDFEYKDKKWFLYLEDFMINLKGNNVEYNYKKKLINNNVLPFSNEELNEYDNEIVKKVMNFINILEIEKNDRKEIKTNKIKKLDLTAYILLNGYNMDARLTANGWEIGVYVWKNSKVLEVRDFLQGQNIKIESEMSQHLWLKHFDYNEDIRNIVKYYIKIYDLIK